MTPTKYKIIGFNGVLPPYDSKVYEEIGTALGMTEEVARGIVEKNQYGHNGWRTYTVPLMYWEATALESFHSWLIANECYLVNPLGSEPPYIVNEFANTEEYLEAKAKVSQWHSYQSKTFNDYLILKEK